MGNYNTRSVRFLQSPSDFPLMVSLGEKNPTWGVSRWGGRGLRFVPPDDEGFSVRGDKQRLVYKGRRRSHRFTILGDNSFEYDCILNKEPKSNVVSLLMEGAECFVFFRQPDFVPDPFLKGSYAVYKKETLVGEGTGKLCHINRPLIIDALGRRCWGDLAVFGNELRITIPEQWLSEAAYPVIVDPVVGTTTVGSQTIYYDEDNEGYYEFFVEFGIAVNRFLLPETFNGSATAYVYAYNTDYWGKCKPALYSDNNNSPLTRRSANEGQFDIEVKSGKPAGWRATVFQTNISIASGTYIWFGFLSEWFATRFDYGAKLLKGYYNENINPNANVPETYPLIYSTEYNFKLSMYFDYTSAQNYVRTLTQGITLADSRKLTADYKRNATETVQANSTANRLQAIYRKIQETIQGIDNNSLTVLFFRSVLETVTVAEAINHFVAFFRGIFDNAKIEGEASPGRFYFLTLTDTVQAAGAVFRGLLLFVRITTGLFVRDYILKRFLIAREELLLKSCITREIILESKIN